MSDTSSERMLFRPAVVAFDVIETLFPIEPLRAKLVEICLPAHALEIWFAQLLRDAFASDCAGRYLPFRSVAISTLERLTQGCSIAVDRAAIGRVVDGFSQLDAHPDVMPAMQLLRKNGVRIVTLTNGSLKATQNLIARAGLSDYVDDAISIDDVGRWKPAREVYLFCAKKAGVAAADMALVASHAWDVQGAMQAGYIGAYIERSEGRYLDAFPRPDVTGTDLATIASHLSMLPRQASA